MAVTSEYDWSLELDHLAATINAAEVWRAVCAQPDADWATVKALADAATADDADSLARIHYDYFEPDTIEDRPFSLIRHLTEGDIEKAGTTGWDTTGQLMWFLELPVPEAYKADLRDAGQYIRNVIGRLIYEMQIAVQTVPAGKLCIQRFSRGPFGQIDPDQIDGALVWSADFVVHHLG